MAFVLLVAEFFGISLLNEQICHEVSEPCCPRWNVAVMCIKIALEPKFAVYLAQFWQMWTDCCGPVLLYSSVCRLSVCRLSVVCNVGAPLHPTQTIGIFGNVFTPFGTLDICWLRGKILGDRPRGTPHLGVLNRRGEAKYRDFGPLQDNISETVQDRR